MNSWAIIPLVSCIAYAVLAVLVLLQARSRVNRMFTLFLFAAGAWSLSSFMLTSNLTTSSRALIFWNDGVLVLAMFSNFAYYHFVRTYIKRPPGIVTYVGYALVLTMLAFSFSGHMVKDVYLIDGYLYHDIGPWAYVMVGVLAPLLIITMWMLVREYRRSTDPIDRNRTMYLMVGWGIMGFWSATNANVPLLALLPTDHLGAIVNALIIAYAIGKLRLLDIRVVGRRGLAFSMVFITIGVTYTGFILLLYQFFSGQQLINTILIVTAFTVLISLLGRPIRHFFERQVDHFFHREAHVYRQALHSFRSRMSTVLNLDEVANEMLPTISKALRLTQAKLLVQETGSGDFIPKFIYPPVEGGDDKLRFSADNPIVVWLAKEGEPLDLENTARIPQLRALWAAEKEELAASGLELLYPIKSQGKLVGILALGKKQASTLFYPEDIELVTSITGQAGVVIENAQLFNEATVRANTDELTALYNHRHFHERLKQEIDRGSRFGTTFSLIMMDIDIFKTYNDIYGHLAGDEVLRRVGKYIDTSVRSVDMAFRYGGEEFTVILPETRLDDAYKVAERVRKTIEVEASSEVVPITVSLGIASWPIDGMTSEEIIACADTALYRAKETGRNRTCLSSDVAKPEASLVGMALESKARAMSIIYALAATVDAKDHYTYGHSKKVSQYAVTLSERLGLPQDRIATIRAAGLLHDIGKIAIPDSILNKEEPLTEEEWKPVKAHPELGTEILRHVIDLVNCLPAILHHHEHYDGKGYPSGMKGDSIPMEARILAIADAYDAITSMRPYRELLSPRKALDELKRCSGTQFDPELVDAFCKTIEQTLPKELEIK